MRAITTMQIRQRIVLAGAFVGVVSAFLSHYMGPAAMIVALGMLVVLVMHATRLEQRRAFTEAVGNLKPIERADDPTLFPEEIDPYLAEPKPYAVFGNAMTQIVIALVAFIVTMSILHSNTSM